jgi:aryl-alcohol dehydrogenase-like predicted oxidoreductase
MQYTKLGKTGFEISKLCFGALTIGPLQVDMPVDEGAKVILKALELGVNFIDTAELYGTYSHIRRAVKLWGQGSKPVIATKSYAYTAEGAAKSLEEARKGLDTDVVDIFLLHEQESRLTLRGHRDALDYYLSEKAKGRIKAVGVSTHNVEVVEAICGMDEIDVIHPIINRTGIGIGDGSIEDMLKAVKKAYNAGKGIYAMKPLGGGNLLNTYEECMKFVLDIPYVHSIAVGMQSVDEVTMNISVFEGEKVSDDVIERLGRKEKRLHIDYWCVACGRCVERCTFGAIAISDGKARVDSAKCVLCGYCGSVCPQFAIKIC